jgi:hypothetical protein
VDGFWRDYELPPGKSEDWTTAWVGWCLAHAREHPAVTLALRRGARAIVSAHRPGGWGYNREQTPDADSTAWCLRFLVAAGAGYYPHANAEIESYLDIGGSAHTFLEGNAGTWGDPHPDVTPVVGLALLATSASPNAVFRVRRAVLRARSLGGIWSSFWWSSDAYATAWSVEFLARTGGVPPEIAAAVNLWLPDVGSDASVVELAHRLLAALAVSGPSSQDNIGLVNALLDLSDGPLGWPPSALLLIPPKSGIPAEPMLHADVAGLMSTGIATVALSRWVAATGL